MALSQEELTSITSSVLASLRTNLRTIDQLQEVVNLADSDTIEISNGKKITYKTLKDLITLLFKNENDKVLTQISQNGIKNVDVTADANGATLKISTGKQEYSTTIPLAGAKAGLMSAEEKSTLRDLANAGYESVVRLTAQYNYEEGKYELKLSEEEARKLWNSVISGQALKTHHFALTVGGNDYMASRFYDPGAGTGQKVIYFSPSLSHGDRTQYMLTLFETKVKLELTEDKISPIKVESEEAMEKLVSEGAVEKGRIYYTVEED